MVAKKIKGTTGNDKLLGSDGNDRIFGLSGNDTLFGGSGKDILEGGGGDDRLAGQSESDQLFGGKGADKLDGGEGNDTLFGGEGGDRLNGGAGIDTASYAGATVGVTVDLWIQTVAEGEAVGDSLKNIEIIEGSSKGDRLFGDPGSNTLKGGAGNDVLDGRDGADLLVGGKGLDVASYSNSFVAVTINLNGLASSGGPAAGDKFSGIEGAVGSANGDTLNGNSAANTFFGAGGDDSLSGAGGADTLVGGDGDDNIIGGSGIDFMHGGDGTDTFIFSSASQSGVGTGQRDRIYDFSQEGDRIDFSAIDANVLLDGDQAFQFISTSSFDGTGGQVRYFIDMTAGITIVQFDVDGDGNLDADMEVQLDSTVNLIAGDILL